jgi:hypothetical protein
VPHDNANDTNFIATTSAGFSYLTSWGSARYDTAAQLEALAYRKNLPTDPQSVLFSNWAMGQMNYLMGDNPAKWSYIVGFGSTTPGVGSAVGGTATAPSHPHHGDAQGSLTNSQGSQITVNITNLADEPPHFETDMSARVYFDVSSLYKAGQTISAISNPVYYDAASQIDGRPTSISAPHSGATRTAASTTSPSTGPATISGCRRRALSNSASTRRSGRTISTTGVPPHRRASPAWRRAPTPRRPTRTSLCT